MTESPVLVVGPDEGESYWQPVPANGHIEIRVSHRKDPRITGLAHGIQVVAPGCHIREHVHPKEDELLFFFQGEGEALIDGETRPIRTGTSIYVGRGHRHRFDNTGTGDMAFAWVMVPGGDNGLDDFFARIGRPRKPGEPAPEPFPRPADVEQIEAETVFSKIED
jgi:mannose-6-phosphate isomerase-like protein (cupin superfamily)